jgi:hypothetical protein
MAKGQRGARALHPLLFGAFPVLFLFRQNLWGLTLSEIALPLAATLGCIAAVQLLIGSAVTHRPRKVAVVLSLVTLLFFSYGHVWRVTTDGTGRLFGLDADIVLGAAGGTIVSVVVIAIVRTARSLNVLTGVLNVIALATLATVAVPLGAELLQNRASAETPAEDIDGLARAQATGREPDIYYLVFDRYAGGRTLQELFGYDNRDLLDFLHDRRFHVADRARANYQSTVPSLASSLNMRYLDWIADAVKGRSNSSLPMYDAIRENEVARSLQRRGYRYVHIGSRWDVTRSSPLADTDIRNDATTEFTRVFFGSTALLPAMRHGVLTLGETDRPETARRITLKQLQQIADVRRMSGPKFVFAHLGVPHPPYVFDRTGRAVDEQPLGVPPKARAYLEQLRYTNTRIKEIVTKLMDVPAAERPVIVLQADEGPYPSFGYEAPSPWWTTTDEKLRTKFRILLATYLPGVEAGTYRSMSPVNVFRVIFNSYFGTQLDILPDESYVPTDKRNAYVWTRITDRLKDPPGIRPTAYPPYVEVLPQVRRSG